MSSTWTCDLGTITFTAHTDGWSQSRKLAYEVIGFPGGNTFDISVAGQREMPRNIGMLLDSLTDYETLETMLGEQGYLHVEQWDSTPRSAMLVAIDPQPTIYNGGYILATGKFIL